MLQQATNNTISQYTHNCRYVDMFTTSFHFVYTQEEISYGALLLKDASILMTLLRCFDS